MVSNYNIVVKFKENKMELPTFEKMVQNDFNLIQFDFDFDIEDGTKVFRLFLDDIETGRKIVWEKEIIDNKLTFGDKDENGNFIPVITESGKYQFEVSLYKDNGRFTVTKTGKIKVRNELRTQDDIQENPKFSILDDMIAKATNALEEAKKVEGKPGKSAYEVACENGFEGAVDEWLLSLKGEQGDTPDLSDYATKESIGDINSILATLTTVEVSNENV